MAASPEKSEQGCKILIIEAFYGGSHKQLVDLLFDKLTGCVRYTLPAKKWHWRARTSALYFSQRVPRCAEFRVLFTSSVLNLAELSALRPDLGRLRKVLYFHENQLVYPVRKQQNRDFQYGYNQILSSLVADIVLFNSTYNRDSFLDNISSFLKLMPDHRPKGLAEQIRLKCQVLYFPLSFMCPGYGKTQNTDASLMQGTPHSADPHTETDSPYGDPQTETDSRYSDPQTETDSPYSEPQTETDRPFSDPQTETDSPYSDPQTEAESPYSDPQTETDSPYSDPQTETDRPFSDPQTETDSPYSDPQTEVDRPYRDPQTEVKCPHRDPHENRTCSKTGKRNPIPPRQGGPDVPNVEPVSVNENIGMCKPALELCSDSPCSQQSIQGKTGSDVCDAAKMHGDLEIRGDLEIGGNLEISGDLEIRGDQEVHKAAAAGDGLCCVSQSSFSVRGQTLQMKSQCGTGDRPLHIVWAHRWEHDKDPDTFFQALFRLHDEGYRFQVSVMGETYTDVPEIFSDAKFKLGDHIVTWGYQGNKRDYYSTLQSADVAVSTALHEFFGVAMLEAVHCGCFPLCPDNLVYPEIFPAQCLYRTPTQLYKRLREYCRKPHLARTQRPQIDLNRFRWETLQEKFEQVLYVD